MSVNHKGNTEPSISQEEHEAALMPPTKRVLNYGYDGAQKNIFFIDNQGISRSIVSIAHPISTTLGGNMTLNPSPNYIGLTTTTIASSPTLFAVVNTAAAGQSSVVLDTGSNWIGLVTSAIGSAPTLYAVVNTGSSSSNVTLNPSPNYIGLVTVANTVPVTGTFWQSTQPVSVIGNTTLNPSPNYIGLVTVANTVPVTGTFWQTTQPISFTGNLTLNPSSNYIGLATVIQANQPALVAGTAYVGLASVNIGGTLPPLSAGSNFIGLATIHHGGGNVSLNASNAWIGLATTVNATSTAWIGLATTVNATSTAWIGLATTVNAASSAYIGLVTVVPTYLSTYTSFATIISAAGVATIVVPPANQRWILKDLIVSSLGRNEVAVWAAGSGSTVAMIPYISLSTTGGYVAPFGDSGLAAQSENKSLNFVLSGAATVSFMANLRFR